MIDKSIKAIFDEECSHLKINRDFIKKVINLESGFVNKKPEHVQFFG
jgi:hypothetical protein